MELDTDKKGSLRVLKEALMTKAGIAQDPLMIGHAFGARHQGPLERAADFATALRRLFIQAYPEEKVTSSVLLQQFLTGLLASCQQASATPRVARKPGGSYFGGNPGRVRPQF